MEYLDYLIRTLTYKRSCLELDLTKAFFDVDKYQIQGKIDGIQLALDQVYKLLNEITE